MTRKSVSEMTYNVPIGALNSTIPYHTVLLKWLQTKLHCYQATRATKNKPRQLSLWQSNNSPTAVPKVSLKNQETFPNIMRTGRGGSRISEWGAQVERRRREYRGAPRGLGLGRGYPPPQWGRGLGRELCPLPRKFFEFQARNAAF